MAEGTEREALPRHSCLSVPSVHHTSIKHIRSVTGASARQTATISRRVQRRKHPGFHAWFLDVFDSYAQSRIVPCRQRNLTRRSTGAGFARRARSARQRRFPARLAWTFFVPPLHQFPPVGVFQQPPNLAWVWVLRWGRPMQIGSDVSTIRRYRLPIMR